MSEQVKVVCQCKVCKGDFEVPMYKIVDGGGVYCSRKCQGIDMIGRKLSEYNKQKLREANVGRNCSEETKEKISKSRLERKKRLGYLNSKDTRKKISKSNTGKKQSDGTIQKRIKSNTGKHRSIKTKIKMSKAQSGEKNHMFGKHMSEKTKEKIRYALSGEKSPMFGKHHTMETRKKLRQANLGEKSHTWKGGISPKDKLIRRSLEYKEWRNAVFIRDNYTCQYCYVIGGKLNAHHIYSFIKFPGLRFDKDNGVTLCEKCHKYIHTRIKEGNNVTKY